MMITVNETGAESSPMLIDGQNVYVVVSENEAALMVAGEIVAVTSPEGMTATSAQSWAVDYRAGQVADEAVNPEAVYADAVAPVRS